MKKNLFVVLMAGGVGVRFWPYSRNTKPKQFLDVLGTGKTLLQSTYERFLPICSRENIYVVTHEEHAPLVREQLPGINESQILAEPMRKNTAACIAYASYKINLRNKDAVIVVSPSDHLILKESEFISTISKAVSHADQDKLITLGITPIRPETGYGYIQFIPDKKLLKKVKTFTEKPEISLAKKFLESGDFVWNSGIFIWGVKAILDAIQEHLPEMAEEFEENMDALDTAAEKEAIERVYAHCKSISIDYGVMEKAGNVYVCQANFSWSDLGSWNSIHDISTRDKNNNMVTGRTLVYDTRNSIIRSSSSDRLLVVQGLNGYLVGEFGDVVIVCEKDREDLFRQFVNDVKAMKGGGEFL
jgi:mannose-1-phosphate guanylyltransferase